MRAIQIGAESVLLVVCGLVALFLVLSLLLSVITGVQRMVRRERPGTLWPGSNAAKWPPAQSLCTPEWPCDPEDGWICTVHVAEGISRMESWLNHA